MKKLLKEYTYDEIKEKILQHDQRVVFDKTNVIPDETELLETIGEYIDYDHVVRQSVLGIDIYQYSAYGHMEQTLIPFLFQSLFHTAIEQCLENHAYIFQNYTKERVKHNFISTGDGGFVIFDNPLQALIFACNFAVVLRIYNAFHYYPKLRKIIGGISCRYAITYDKVYSYEDNFYGRAIINNARILSKDNLNRCLIDEYVHRWFTTNIEGLENLQVITLQDIQNIYDFNENYDVEPYRDSKDAIFEDEPTRRSGIINSDILKIGKIKSKNSELSIYNLHIQVSLRLINDDDTSQTKVVTVSLGNLNTSGI